MLEDITSRQKQRRIYRLHLLSDQGEEPEKLMQELKLDSVGLGELQTFLGRKTNIGNTDDLLDAPFQKKVKFRRATRFSDGSFPVFYSSLDSDTAQAEMKYWLPKYIGQAKKPRKVYYRQFSCRFDGQEKDIRTKVKDLPDLTSDDDYTFCNQVGAEANKLKLDGIVTVSVRRKGGDNLPVFCRSAIGHAELEDLLIMTFDPESNQIVVEKING